VSLAIRTAQPEDLAAISRLAGELVRLHHHMDEARFLLAPGVEEGYRRYIASQLPDEASVILAAELGGEVVGYAYGRMEPRDWNLLLDACGQLHDVFVDPRHRRQGIARALVQAAIDALESKGAPRVLLHTAIRNEEAQRLFRSLGFRSTMLEMTRERSSSAR